MLEATAHLDCGSDLGQVLTATANLDSGCNLGEVLEATAGLFALYVSAIMD